MSEKDEKSAEDVQRNAYVTALRRERAGYELRGLKDRQAAVDAELKRLGATVSAAREEQHSAEKLETAADSKPRRTASRSQGKAIS